MKLTSWLPKCWKSLTLSRTPNRKARQMDLVKLLQDLATSIAALTSQLADAQAAADASAKMAYDKGFADGVASVPPVTDKIYSQAELDAAVAGAVQPLIDQVAMLNDQVAAMQGQIDQKVAEAVAALKADLLVKMQALDADAAALEELLK